MKKGLIILGVIILLLAGGYFFLVAPAPVSAAILYIDQGQVQVNTGGGWQAATNEMELDTGDGVKTMAGEATVVLLEGEVMTLSENTEVKLESIGSKIKVSQLAGETWNKINKISGVEEYSVETPTTVATVRGTEFFLSLEEINVIGGEVEFGSKDDPSKRIKVRAGQKANNNLEVSDIIPDKMAERQARMQNYISTLKKVREREIRKHSKILKMAEKKGYGEDDMNQLIEDVDSGKESEEALYEKVPAAFKPKAERTYLLTKEIKRALAEQ